MHCGLLLCLLLQDVFFKRNFTLLTHETHVIELIIVIVSCNIVKHLKLCNYFMFPK
jgi:hypothetical protein